MRILLFLLRKEFKQIFRNRSILPMIFVMPIIQLLILPLAADYEIKNININIVDHDHSSYSQQLISKIVASGYFKLSDYSVSYKESFFQIEQDQADLILEIPQGFERKLLRENSQKLFLAINAINGMKASLGGAYLSKIIQNYNTEIREEWASQQVSAEQPATIDVTISNWFNPYLNYNYFMVPGILALLVTMVGTYMCSLNIVKEKEMGTIEQINVTPIKKYQFILGKLIPFWIIGIFVFTVGLFLIGQQVYGIFSVGSLGLLYAFLAVYLVAVLGLGLLISTYSNTQQQAMSITFFFMMIFLLMSGLFTSVDSMPDWAKVMAYLNPVTYFIEVVRMIILKGSGFEQLKVHFLALVSFAIFLNTCAVWNYKKTS